MRFRTECGPTALVWLAYTLYDHLELSESQDALLESLFSAFSHRLTAYRRLNVAAQVGGDLRCSSAILSLCHVHAWKVTSLQLTHVCFSPRQTERGKALMRSWQTRLVGSVL